MSPGGGVNLLRVPRNRFLRRVLLACTCAAACLAGAVPSRAEDDLAVVRAAEGCRLARPSAEWRVRDQTPPATVHHAFSLERSPAPAEVSFFVYVGDASPGTTDVAMQDLAVARWTPRAAGAVERGLAKVADGDAPTVTFDLDRAGVRLRVRQAYLVHAGEAYVLQCLAPSASFAAHEAEFAAVLRSFAFLPPDPERAAARGLRLLASRCGSEVPRAATWESASARAAKEHRLVLVVFELYRGLPVPDIAATTLLMDDDFVALCRERLVVLPWRDEDDAPFEDPAAYGLGPHTFGAGVLLATPQGRVVGSAGLLEPSLVDEAARAALDACPEATGAPFDAKDAAAALRRGDLDRAETLLGAPATTEEWRLRAALHRRRHEASDALDALARAVEAGLDPKQAAAERGLVCLRANQAAMAEAAFREAGDLPAARYWRAVMRAAIEGLDAARDELRAVAAGDPKDRFTWRAAAMLLGRGAATGAEAIVWPDDDVRAAFVPHAAAPAAADEARAASAAAVVHLVRTQRKDGTWPVPMSFSPDPTAPTVVAATALAGSALLRHRGRPDADAAVSSALTAVLRAGRRLSSGRGGVFDYTIWGQICALRFLAQCVRTLPETDGLLAKAMAADLVAALARTRQPSGGWAYVRLVGADGPIDNSISFVTAAALLALHEARDAGIDVPDDVVERAADAVASLRRKDGSFGYQTGVVGITAPTEAALRGPLCALALARSGRADAAASIVPALDAFAAVCDPVLREVGKPLCHTAPDGTAAYCILFGCRYAAEAVGELPAGATRDAARRTVLAEVLRLRRDDGSFCDFPTIGPAYGTAMALAALDALE